MEYTAENYIEFIELGRNDKISKTGLKIIATRFRELERMLSICQFNNQPPQMSQEDSYRWHTMNARATLYPNKTIEEVKVIIEDNISKWKQQEANIFFFDFIDINKELPKKTQEVEVFVIGNGNFCKCMFYNEKSDMFPNGFFGTYYKMVIDNVTHWRYCS